MMTMQDTYTFHFKTAFTTLYRFTLFLQSILGLIIVYLLWIREFSWGILLYGLGVLFLYLWIKKKYPLQFLPRFLRLNYFGCFLFLFFLNAYELAGATLLLMIIFWFSVKEKFIYFKKEHIRVSLFFAAVYEWKSVYSVVLKDEIISITKLNNDFLQFPVDTKFTPDEVLQFNIFCREQINMAFNFSKKR